MKTFQLISILVPVVLLMTSGNGIARAQTNADTSDLMVAFVNGNQITAEPGGVTTVVFRITSTWPSERTVDPYLELPGGWRIVGEARPLTMDGAGSMVGFISLRAPQTVAAGSYEIRLVVRDSARPKVQAAIDATVVVSSLFGIDLSVSSSAEYVRAGTDVLITVTVSNRGNEPVRVALDATAHPDVDVRLDSFSVHLGPMKSRSIQLTMSTDAHLTRETVYQTYVRARAEDLPASFESVIIRIHVIPAFSRSGQGIGKKPLLLSLQSVGDERSNGAQVGVSGAFDALGGTVDIEMLVANRQRLSMFGSRDMYRVMYTSDRFELQMGDQLQNLSPLTTTGEYGAGLGAYVTGGKLSFRGFAQRSRFTYPQQSLFGTSIGFRPGQGLAMSLNALHRVGNYEGTVVTARSVLTPFGPNHALDLECGLDSGADFEKPSCRADATGRTGGLTYQGRMLRTTESYPGPRGHTTEESARATYRLPFGLSVEGAISRQGWSILADYKRSVSHDQVGIGFDTRSRRMQTYSRLYYLSRTWAYDAPGFTIDRTEDLLRLQLGFHTRSFDVHGTADIGRSKSASSGYSGPSRRYQITTRIAPVQRFSISATGEHGSGYLTVSDRPTRIWMLNVRTAFRFNQRTELSTTYYRNIIESTVRQPYNSFKAQAKHTFKSGSLITLQFQYSALSGLRSIQATDYRLAYSIPIGLPARRKPSPGTFVSGRIYDAESGAGLNGILLFLGDHATLSDETGRFVIPKPAGQTTYLTIDQRSMGYDSVPMVPMPYEIRPDDDRPDVLEIPIMRAASVRGTVSRYGPKGGERLLGDRNASLERLAGVGNVILGLSSGTAEYRARTDPSGSFEFQNVVPGDYVVRVIAPLRIAYHRFEPDSLQISLGGGSNMTIEFRAVPESREIRMVPPLKPIITLGEREGTGTPPVLINTPALKLVGSSAAITAASMTWASNPLLRFTLIVDSSLSERDATRAIDQFSHFGLPLRILKSDYGSENRFLAAMGQFKSSAEADLMRQKLAVDLPENTRVYRFIR